MKRLTSLWRNLFRSQRTEQNLTAGLETLWRDCRYGVRSLSRTPGFTIAAVLALSLGIGATTAILSVVNAVLLRPLPYRDPGRLVVMLQNGRDPVAPGNFLDWQRRTTSFASVGAAEYWTPNLAGADRPDKVWALRLTPEILPMLGVAPELGRVFSGDERVAVIGHAMWQRVFAGDPAVVGRTITLDGVPFEVVGVMPGEFKFAPFWATRAELWVPMDLASRANDRGGGSLRVFARLRDGVTLGEARAEMAAITASLEREYPGTNRDIVVQSLTEKVVGDVRRPLLVLLVAVAFVAVTACANVAHMLLARAAARRREMAVRTAIGASRGRIVRQLLTESVVLALAGGAGGLILATVGVRALLALGPAGIPRVDTVAIDAPVIAVTFLLSLVTGLVFGMAPAWSDPAASISRSLREGGRGTTAGVRGNRLRNLLVGSEVALALVLLAGAGLMIRTFAALRAVDPGFNPNNVLSVVVSVTGTREGEPGRRGVFFQELVQRVSALPGVTAASAINHLPLFGDEWGWPFIVEGQPVPAPGEWPSLTFRVVLPGYFETMQLPITAGRDVAERDNLDAERVVVISEALARQHFRGTDPLGKRIALDNGTASPSWLTVVGVVRDARQSSWAQEPRAEAYLPYFQTRSYLESPASWVGYLTLVVRSAGDPAALAPAIRNIVASLDRNVPVSDVVTMSDVVTGATAEPRFYLVLLATFAGVTLVLAGVGIYGVVSYTVARRKHELGIRMALGADKTQVVGLVVWQGMRVALAGAAAGLLAAFGLTRLMGALLYGVNPTDVVTFAVVPVVLSVVALVACYVPARHATRVDPLTALRHD